MASGISNTFRLGGVATGVSALGALFQHRLASTLHASVGHVPGLAQAVAAGGVQVAARAGGGRAGVVVAARHGFVDGVHLVFVVGAICVLAGALFSSLVRGRDFVQHSVPSPRPAVEAEAGVAG
jgi:hypothetical protein